MCQRNSCKSQKPTTTLRRSPRFLQQDQPNTDNDPRTPEPQSRRIRGSYSNLTPLSSIGKCSLNKPQRQRRGEDAEKAKETRLRPTKETRLRPKSSKKLSTEHRRSAKFNIVSKESRCLRRSPRFSENCNVKGIGCEESKQKDLSKAKRLSDSRRKSASGIDRPGTSSSVRGNNEEVATNRGSRVICYVPGEVVDVQSRSGRKVTPEVNRSKQILYKIEKRVTRSSSRGNESEDIPKCGNFKGDKPIEHASFECLDKGVLSQEGNIIVDMKKKGTGKPVNRRKCRISLSADAPGEGDIKGFANEVEKNLVGMKRKGVEAKEGHRIVQGWTREQELTLQRAYFAAKPTPHFWKKVSKMVPGKSAQDCFNKIHSGHLTPPQPQPRSRAKQTNSSSLSFSASKLLTSSEPKRKKVKSSKQKSFLSHKAVRELLQKQYKIDQDDEADLFTVLEPTVHPSIRIIADGSLCSTPEYNNNRPCFLKRCPEGSSSAQRKHLSRFNASPGATLTSPPVLKQVKNKALHEKYIDQLHTREAKRNAASLRAKKCIQRKNDAKPNDARWNEVVEATKDALIFEAREAIDQFHHLQNCMTNNDDDYDDLSNIAEDDIEDGS